MVFSLVVSYICQWLGLNLFCVSTQIHEDYLLTKSIPPVTRSYYQSNKKYIRLHVFRRPLPKERKRSMLSLKVEEKCQFQSSCHTFSRSFSRRSTKRRKSGRSRCNMKSTPRKSQARRRALKSPHAKGPTSSPLVEFFTICQQLF